MAQYTVKDVIKHAELQNIRFANALMADGWAPSDQSIVGKVVATTPPKERSGQPSNNLDPWGKKKPTLAEFSATLKRVDLARRLTRPPSKGLKSKKVLKAVSKAYEVSVDELLGPKRDLHITTARHAAFYHLHVELNWSLSRIGEKFSKDHTTVLHGVRRHRERNGLPK